MAARASLYNVVNTDPVLIGLGLGAVYPTNAVDSPAETFFAVIRWETTLGQFKDRGVDQVSIWFHDKNRDYGRINSALNHLKFWLPSLTHVAGADGYSLTAVEWRGESPDLYDGGYETLCRYIDLSAVSRYTGAQP